MKKYFIIIVLITISSFFACSQNPKTNFHSGNFVTVSGNFIIYYEDKNNDGESIKYLLEVLNFKTKEKVIIDSNLTCYDCIALSNFEFGYTNGRSIIVCDSNFGFNKKYYEIEKDWEIISLNINQEKNKIILIKVNYKTYEAIISILDRQNKSELFHLKIKLNENEIEGLNPLIKTINNFFIVGIQDKLISIDYNKLTHNQISEKYDAFALNENGVLYYEFTSDEGTEGFFYDPLVKQSNKIDNYLNSKIFNCIDPIMITGQLNNINVPYYVICGNIFYYNKKKWQEIPNIVLFKNGNIEIDLVKANDKINFDKFEYKVFE